MKFGRVAKGSVVAGGVAAAVAGFVSMKEGRSLTAYRDIVGVVTICDGDTTNVKMGQRATHAECDARLIEQLRIHERGMDKCLKVDLPFETKKALLSFTYNVGVGAFCKSTLLIKVNIGDTRGACDELLKWNRAGGRVVRGLTIRREEERKMCLEGLK